MTEQLDRIYKLLISLALSIGYEHTFAIKLYQRDGINYFNVNPVCKDGYRFALQVSKLKIANDNLA